MIVARLFLFILKYIDRKYKHESFLLDNIFIMSSFDLTLTSVFLIFLFKFYDFVKMENNHYYTFNINAKKAEKYARGIR